MNKFIVASTVFTALLGFSVSAIAYDNDPGYGSNRPIYSEGRGYLPWQGGRNGLSETFFGSSGSRPLYYRPTQRYYGPGYTVNYRYIPVYRGDGIREVPVTGATNFRSEAFKLAPDDVPAWGANSPKVTVKDPRSAVARTAVTSIVRKKTSSKVSTTGPDAAPVITPSTTDGAAPVPSPAKP